MGNVVLFTACCQSTPLLKNYSPVSLRQRSVLDGSALKMFPRGLWLLFPLFASVQAVFQKLYCSLSDSCECDFRPNLRGLEWDLYKNVFGQHLAQDAVAQEVAQFLQNKSPERPLVLSFHGGSGTGKTLVSSMLGTHLYGSGMSSPYVHQFVPTLHFPDARRLEHYRRALKDWVQGNLTACARSVFIFDEMDKMPPGLVDVLEPFLGPFHVVYSTNYRKAIYVFISTVGEKLIRNAALDARSSGRDRDEIKLSSDLEDAIALEAFNTNHSGFSQSRVASQKLVTRFVPFLPLTRVHVERCVHAQLRQRGQGERGDVVQAVGDAMSYAPAAGHYFSTTGCKAVPAKIDLFL
uniref:Torsin family 2 member A n=1 Tax=Neogobius melanostomus TaxID=47308 RepID=A0A8C6TZE9_9GOBI